MPAVRASPTTCGETLDSHDVFLLVYSVGLVYFRMVVLSTPSLDGASNGRICRFTWLHLLV
jgi:hypothetical protein